jgi:predicted MFS family arabinose efflux permease
VVVGTARAVVSDLRGDGRGWVLFVVAGGWFLLLGSRVVLPAVLPQVRATFGIDNATAGLVVTLVWTSYALTQFPSGLLSDRIGERATLVLSALATLVALAVFALAPTFPLFVLAGVAFGLGSGLYATPRVTILSKVFERRTNSALGITFSAGNAGAAVLPVVAGFVAAALGWRAGLLLVVPAIGLLAAGLWIHVPRDVGGGDSDGGLDAPPREVARRVRDVVGHRAVLLSMLSMTLVLFTYQGITAFLPTYLIEQKGLSATTAATFYGLFYATGAVSQSLLGGVADRLGEIRVLVVFSVAGVLTLVALVVTSNVYLVAVVVALLGTRLGLGSVGNGYAADILPEDVQGTVYGLFRTVFIGVGSLGSFFVGYLASVGLFDEAFLAMGAATGLAAVAFARLPDPDEPEYDSAAVTGASAVAPGDDAGDARDDVTD